MKAVVRVDASAAMGTGHLRRCMSLAMALRTAGWQTHFICRALGYPAQTVLEQEGFSCTLLPEPDQRWLPGDDDPPHAQWAQLSWARDADDTLAVIEGQATNLVVIDHYGFDQRWHEQVRSQAGCRIAVIDDTADRALSPDVLIDHNHVPSHAQKYLGKIPAGTLGLYGPSYALLHPGYAQAQRCFIRQAVRSVGIFMGGIDRDNYTSMALDALAKAGFSGKIEVAASSQYPHLHLLQHRAATSGGDLHITLDQPDLRDFYARHNLQIGASGGATWERCCIGAPSLCIIVAANQAQVLLPLKDMQVLDAIEESPPTVDGLADRIRKLCADPTFRARISENAKLLVDGRGASRVAEYLTNLCTP